MPDGADAVVMQEDTQPAGDGAVRITDDRVKPGQWVFARGTEMRAGDVVLAAGAALTPAALGVLAGLGLVEAKLHPAPRVFVLPTGNELVEPGHPLKPGQIRNSNGPMLAAQVQRAGGVATHRGIGPDTLPELLKLVGDELDGTDVLLVAGGVSVGKYDLVPAVLAALGGAPHVSQVRMKPGRPLLFGTRGDTLVFVRPALCVLAGHPDPGPTTVTLPLAEPIAEANDRPTYRPAKLEVGPTGYAVRPLPWRGAPDLRGLAAADALLVLPAGESRLDPGSLANVVIIN